MAHVAPMLLSTTASEPTGGDWVLEPKWDGFRFLYRLSRGEVRCWSRHGNRHDRKLPYIDGELRDLFPDDTVLDRELVGLGRGRDGVVRHDFEHLRSALATRGAHRPSARSPALQYVVFDASSPGVIEVHDLHVWEVTSGFPALSAHVLVAPEDERHARRHQLERLLEDEFEIEHTTLQVDHEHARELLSIDAPGGSATRTP